MSKMEFLQNAFTNSFAFCIIILGRHTKRKGVDKMSEIKITVESKEAAKMLGVSMPTFYELAAMDGFPVIRKGKRYLVSVAGLQRWVDENCGKCFD